MSVLPASTGQIPVREIDLRKSENSIEPARKKPDEDKSPFAKLLLDKKREKEDKKSVNNEREGRTEKPTPEKPAGKGLAERQAVREAVQKFVRAKRTESSSAIRELLSSLISKKALKPAGEQKEKGIRRQSEKEIPDVAYLKIANQPEKAEKSLRSSALNAALHVNKKTDGQEKNARSVVIVDLRDRAAEKSEPGRKQVKSDAKKPMTVDEPVKGKKPLDTKETFDVKLFSKGSQNGENLEAQRTLRFQEPVDTKTAISSRFGEFMKNEMVKHTGLIVKNGGNGEINLVLKPDSLGSVRIRMNIEDNHIVGKIIVDNNIVKAIMEENLPNLENALHEGGYENSTFEVFVAGERQNDAERDASFASLLGEHGGADLAAVGEYERSDAVYYSESLVNIVL